MNKFDDIPEWLLRPSNNVDSVSKAQLSFLRRTLTQLLSVFSNEIYLNKSIYCSGLLQKIDPRCKIIVLIGFIITTNFCHSWLQLFTLFAISLLYAKLSNLAIKKYLIRTWAYIPFFILICSIPALFNIFNPGIPVLKVLPANINHKIFIHGLYVSSVGIEVVCKLFLRSGITISFSYLLIMTTSWHHITKSLSSLRLPNSFIVIMDMAYRYIFLLSIIALQLIEARFIRSVGKLDNNENRKFIGHSIAFLFIKASFVAHEVFFAMRLRGFSGKYKSLDIFKITKLDIIFVLNNLILFMMLLFFR